MIPTQSDFTREEWRLIQQLRTPIQVQRYLFSVPYNRPMATCLSFRGVVSHNMAYCLEGAIFAAAVLEQHGYPPLVVSMESKDKLDHVVFLFKHGGRFGAVARSRDTGLHGRKPVFRTVRDLVMSYFDAYVDNTARLTGYAVANLCELGNYDWRLSNRNVWKVERYLQEIPHHPLPTSEMRYLKWLRRYRDFHERYPDRSPVYFPNRDQWML
jgi:hypothetical protein